MDWNDPKTGNINRGFREMGFLPEAFVNMLALLGWNNATEQELFSLAELVADFRVDRISKAGAKFDFEKARWFNAEWIKKLPAQSLKVKVTEILKEKEIIVSDERYLEKVIDLVKDRLVLLNDFWTQASFFFKQPGNYDLDAVKPKWTAQKAAFFQSLIQSFNHSNSWEAAGIESLFKSLAESSGIKPGELMLPFRVMLVGGKFGPHVFDIAEMLGKAETAGRVESALSAFTDGN
jgi:glutamyl-tRNA synthetase